MPPLTCRGCGVPLADGDGPGFCAACQAGTTAMPTQAPSAAAPPSRPPEAFPGYEILGELGRGGMGVVFQARQVELDRPVALKVILAGGYAGESEKARFRAEAEAIARMSHPNIIQVYDFGECKPAVGDPTPFVALEFCAKGNLHDRLRKGTLAPHVAAGLIETLARAMQHAHERQVLHRDLKPANVLFDAKGTPKIADFGMAKRTDLQGATLSGTVMGTPAYMATEQAAGRLRELGPHTDVWALGAILYECLGGRPPFLGETAMETVLAVLNDPVPELPPGVPEPLKAVCRRCMQKKPADRYPTAQALADDLRRYLVGGTVSGSAPAAPGVLTTPHVPSETTAGGNWALALAGVVLLAAVAVGAWFLFSGKRKPSGGSFEPDYRLADGHGEMMKQQASDKGAFAVAFDAAGRRVAVGDGEGRIGVWDLKTRQFQAKSVADGPVKGVAFDRGGERILFAAQGVMGSVDAEGLEEPSRVAWKGDGLRRVLFREGEVWACLEDGSARRWAAGSDRVEQIRLCGRALNDAAPRPGTREFVVASGDEAIALRLVEPGGKSGDRFESFGIFIPSRCAVTADGLVVVSGEGNGRVTSWDAETGFQRHTFGGHKGEVEALASSSSGRRALSGGGGAIKSLDLNRNAEDETFDAAGQGVRALCFSPDGRHFASAGGDGWVRVWGLTPPKRK